MDGAKHSWKLDTEHNKLKLEVHIPAAEPGKPSDPQQKGLDKKI